MFLLFPSFPRLKYRVSTASFNHRGSNLIAGLSGFSDRPDFASAASYCRIVPRSSPPCPSSSVLYFFLFFFRRTGSPRASAREFAYPPDRRKSVFRRGEERTEREAGSGSFRILSNDHVLDNQLASVLVSRIHACLRVHRRRS